MTRFTWHDSPIGRLFIAADDDGIRALEFPENRHPVKREGDWREGAHPLLDAARRQLDAYFAGQRRSFELPLAPRGTPFQLAAWNALRQIPWGQTRSYAQQAIAIGRPAAVRAVGAANGRNPIPIIVPCHRVIGSGGALTGFGGGIEAKRFLLRLEGIEA